MNVSFPLCFYAKKAVVVTQIEFSIIEVSCVLFMNVWYMSLKKKSQYIHVKFMHWLCDVPKELKNYLFSIEFSAD